MDPPVCVKEIQTRFYCAPCRKYFSRNSHLINHNNLKHGENANDKKSASLMDVFLHSSK